MQFNYSPKKIKEGIKEIRTNRKAAREGNKAALRDNESLAIKQNLKKFNTTPSKVKADMEGSFPSKNTKEYLKARDASIKAGKTRMKF